MIEEVTVIMLTYKHEQYIEQAINGILEQKFEKKIKLLISNDCSPDNTHEIVQRIINKNPQSNLIEYHLQEKNLGMMNNFIWCLNQAKGKYIAYCEGDDYWVDPLKIQKQYDFLEKHIDIKVCYTDCYFSDNTNYRKIYESRVPNITWPHIYDFSQVIQTKGGPTLTLFFKREALNLNLLESSLPKSAMGDWPLEMILIQQGKGCILSDKTAMYRVHDQGASKKILNKENYFYTRSIVCQELLKRNIVKENKVIIHSFLVRLYLQWALLKYSKFEIKELKNKLSLTVKFLMKKKKRNMKWIKMYTFKSIFLHFIKLSVLIIVPAKLHSFLPKRITV